MLIKQLVELANKLDEMGLVKEANQIDELIKTISTPLPEEENEIPDPEPFI